AGGGREPGETRQPRPRLKPGKGMKSHDPASQADLSGKSLNSGTTQLQNAGLVRVPQPDGSYNFVDALGRTRARWVAQSGQEPRHWNKFEPSGDEKHYLDNAGRPVTG